METLIELYSERAIENVLGPEVFRPKRIIYLSPQELVEDKERQKKLQMFFKHRGLNVELLFAESSLYKSDRIRRQIRSIVERYKDCALDVTGGTDAALFGAGMFCESANVPTFTYSRKQNKFYDIKDADFADERPCDLIYTVEDFFLMAGGTLRAGRVDNSVLPSYMQYFDPFFDVFLKYRRDWVDAITFITRISRANKEGEYSLKVDGSYEQKGERGGRILANEALLRDLQAIGFIQQLEIETGERVAFRFKDALVRAWLRDVGSVLELYMYKACADTGIFDDVVSSAIVDWDGTVGQDSVSNEIDVVASRGCVPIFISCKACEIKTEALNELAILRDRFGGKGAKAVIVTTENCNAAARHRAAQLGITVIDLEELEAQMVQKRLRVIMKVDSPVEL